VGSCQAERNGAKDSRCRRGAKRKKKGRTLRVSLQNGCKRSGNKD